MSKAKREKRHELKEEIVRCALEWRKPTMNPHFPRWEVRYNAKQRLQQAIDALLAYDQVK